MRIDALQKLISNHGIVVDSILFQSQAMRMVGLLLCHFWGVDRRRVCLHSISTDDKCYSYLDYPTPSLLESSSNAKLMDIFTKEIDSFKRHFSQTHQNIVDLLKKGSFWLFKELLDGIPWDTLKAGRSLRTSF